MRSKTKTLVLGSLLAGSLVTSAVPVVAQDYWRWHTRDYQSYQRESGKDLRSDQRDLAEARRQLEYDRSHRANHSKIAQDEARIKEIEMDFRDKPNDSRGNWD
jgi:hypothetical protein